MDIPKLVSHVMTRKVVTLFEEENLESLAEGMRKFRFRHLPVVDGDKLCGLISERDLLSVAASSVELGGAQRTQHINQSLFVRDIMRSNVLTARPDTPLLEAANTLLEHKIGCLPVTEADGRLVGIVTEADFVKLVTKLAAEA